MTKQTKQTSSKTNTKKKSITKTKPQQAPLSDIKKKQPVVDDAAVDAFIMEVDEEVKNDDLKAFFNKYGLFIIIAVVLILSAAVSFETIKNWRANQFKAKTDAYLNVDSLKSSEEMLAALEKIADGNYGIYSELARLQITDILFEQKKDEQALTMLTLLASNDELNPRVRNLAALKLAARQVDTEPYEQIESLLLPIISADDTWTPIAKEYLALSAIKNKNSEKARTLYQEILQDNRISDDFRLRVQDMLSVISDI